MPEVLAQQIQGQRAFQQMTQAVLSTYARLFSIQLSCTWRSFRSVQARIADHDELTVDEASRRMRTGS
jgi:hypothetical protein